MKGVRSFAHFWWSFVVGDDWRLAAAVAVALGLCAALARARIVSWWVTPLIVLASLWLSSWRAAVAARTGRDAEGRSLMAAGERADGGAASE